jgi:uncharacterized protein (TIGR02145 family)
MKTRLFTYIALSLAVLTALSCKKNDDTTTTKPYLYGVNFDLPTFARPGDIFELTPYGVYTEDGKELEKYVYKWKVDSDSYQEMDTFTLVLNEVGNYIVYCQASDPDGNYYAVSTSKVVIVIDPELGKTLTGTGIDPDTDAHIEDARGKKGESEYYYIHDGELDWFRNNLAWMGAGLSYEDADVTSFPLGRYYTWVEAMSACPEGWRLPTLEEWETLGSEAGPLMCDAYLNSQKMWEYWPQVNKTNEKKMSIIPSGYALPALTTPLYMNVYNYAAFWTATESAENTSQAAFRYIFVQENEVHTAYADKGSLALSVRCVR